MKYDILYVYVVQFIKQFHDSVNEIIRVLVAFQHNSIGDKTFAC